MTIKVDYKLVRALWKKALATPHDRDAWLAVQVINALGGKDCNEKIKKMLGI